MSPWNKDKWSQRNKQWGGWAALSESKTQESFIYHDIPDWRVFRLKGYLKGDGMSESGESKNAEARVGLRKSRLRSSNVEKAEKNEWEDVLKVVDLVPKQA